MVVWLRYFHSLLKIFLVNVTKTVPQFKCMCVWGNEAQFISEVIDGVRVFFLLNRVPNSLNWPAHCHGSKKKDCDLMRNKTSHLQTNYFLQPTIIDDVAAFKSSLPLFPVGPVYHSKPTKSKLWASDVHISYTLEGAMRPSLEPQAHQTKISFVLTSKWLFRVLSLFNVADSRCKAHCSVFLLFAFTQPRKPCSLECQMRVIENSCYGPFILCIYHIGNSAVLLLRMLWATTTTMVTRTSQIH